jgi:hypothetical protein
LSGLGPSYTARTSIFGGFFEVFFFAKRPISVLYDPDMSDCVWFSATSDVRFFFSGADLAPIRLEFFFEYLENSNYFSCH